VSILDELGIDPDELRWEALASCSKMDPNWFFDETDSAPGSLTYSDPVTASAVDQVCLSCPVNVDCHEVGLAEKRWGVWGGVYLTDGSIDGKMNKHKTEGEWKEWRDTVESLL
jgi:hypothetical protein